MSAALYQFVGLVGIGAHLAVGVAVGVIFLIVIVGFARLVLEELAR